MTNRMNWRVGAFQASVIWAFVAAMLLLSQSVSMAGPLDLAVNGTQIDSAASCAIAGGKKAPADQQVLMSVLGIGKPSDRVWTLDRQQTDGKATAVQFVVALAKPTPVGAIHVVGTVRSLKVSSTTADPADANAWQPVAIPPAQSGGWLVTLPAGLNVKGVLLSDEGNDGRAEVRSCRLLSERLFNLTPSANPYAQSEYTTPSVGLSAPFTYAATIITTGSWGHWQNVGKDGRGHILRPPVSDLEPAWFILAWQEPKTISGLWVADNFQQVEVEQFAGPADLNPRAGTNSEWKRIKDAKQVTSGAGRFVQFPQPISTRGVRLLITKTGENSIARIMGLTTFTDLKDAKAPEAIVAGKELEPPLTGTYELPFEGTASVVINTPDGKRVRNLYGRRELKAGKQTFGWDLKDEDGRTVPPGEYTWTALVAPTLHFKYEMTVYPNVAMNSPQSTPWHTDMSGQGGWIADHTSNRSGCALGEYVFFGAPVAESGVSMICCDLTGKKLWAIPSFAGFTGAYDIAADNKNVYVTAPGNTNDPVDPSTENVWIVDVKTHEFKRIARLQPSAERKRGIKGVAARDGKLYLSIGAQQDWLASAASGDDLDYEASFPRFAPKRKERFAMEMVPDLRRDFARMFRLTGSPAGSETMKYIETTKGKSARRHVVLAFKKPTAIGSAVLPNANPLGDQPVQVRLATLKPDAPWPPNPGDAKQWTLFEKQPRHAWDVALAPKETVTRALRVTMIRGEADDDLAAGDDSSEYESELGGAGIDLTKKSSKDDDLTGIDGAGASGWTARLDGLKILGRRFENVSAGATIDVNSGKVEPDGSWDAKRTTPLTDTDPGVYAMIWKTPQSLRGLSIKEVDGKRTEIDVFTGEGTPDIKGVTGWEHVSTYIQQRRISSQMSSDTNGDARYMDGYVDFGKEVKTTAVRLRVCEQWLQKEMEVPRWDVPKEKPFDPARCRVFGVAAVRYIGGEVAQAADPRAFQRIEIVDSTTGKVTADIGGITDPGSIAFNPSGDLLAISGHGIVKVNVAEGNSVAAPKHTVIVANDLIEPRGLAFDKAGNIYVYDHAPKRKNIRVYSPAGLLLREIGTPGGYQAGPWDPNRMNDVMSLVIDSKEQLWVVDQTYFPKRISRWTTDGKWQQDFLGNTSYGGGGVLDPNDKSRLFYGPLEFAIDWKTGATRLKNITWTGSTPAAEVPIKIGSQKYLVTRTGIISNNATTGVVYAYKTDRAVLTAAVGKAAGFAPLAQPDVQAELGGKSLAGLDFIWSDTSGDGQVQAKEVTFFPADGPNASGVITDFEETLSVNFGSYRYEVKSYLPTGVPIYERKKLPFSVEEVVRLDNGNYFREGNNDLTQAVFSPSGELLAQWKAEGRSTHGLATAKDYSPDQVLCEFNFCGHAIARAGDLGEFLVAHTNLGSWNIWTADGILAGTIFKDQRTAGARNWSMTEHERGMSMDNVTIGQEHFSGYVTKTSDNKYYAIAGHNHASIIEILGLDQFKRINGKFTVAPDHMVKSEQYERARQKQLVYVRAPVMECYRLVRAPKIDAGLEDWEIPSAAEFGEKPGNRQISRGAILHIGYDDKYLYLAYDVRQLGPIKNSGEQWDRLFKTGGAVDLQIGSDPKAPRDRRSPVAGDKRLLMTFVNNQPRAVLYESVVPGTSPDQAWKAISPVGSVTFDKVTKVDDKVMLANNGGASDRYIVEAAVPLDLLGVKPSQDLRLKIDWGVLVTDPSGNAVMRRIYWANGNTGIVADVPSEARLQPDLWGYALFRDHKMGDAAEPGSNPDALLKGKDGEDKLIKDFESELEEEKGKK